MLESCLNTYVTEVITGYQGIVYELTDDSIKIQQMDGNTVSLNRLSSLLHIEYSKSYIQKVLEEIRASCIKRKTFYVVYKYKEFKIRINSVTKGKDCWDIKVQYPNNSLWRKLGQANFINPDIGLFAAKHYIDSNEFKVVKDPTDIEEFFDWLRVI